MRGPYGVRRLPKLEHTCTSCFPRCVGDACLLSIEALVPIAPPPLPNAMFPLPPAPDAPPTDGSGAAAAGAPAAPLTSRGPYPLAAGAYTRQLVGFTLHTSSGISWGVTLVHCSAQPGPVLSLTY